MNILTKSLELCKSTCQPHTLQSVFRIVANDYQHQLSSDVLSSFSKETKFQRNEVSTPKFWCNPIRKSFVIDTDYNVHLYALHWRPGCTSQWHFHPSSFYRSCVGIQGQLNEMVLEDGKCLYKNVHQPYNIVDINKDAWHTYSNMNTIDAYTLHLRIGTKGTKVKNVVEPIEISTTCIQG